MNLYLISAPFTSIFSLLLGCFVLYKNPRNPVNITWFLSCFSVAIWAAFFCLTLVSTDAHKALVYNKICNASAAYISAFLVHFCLAITRSRRKNLLILAYFGSFVITLFAFTSNFLTVRPISVFNYYPKAGPLYYFYTLHFFFFFSYQLFILINNFNTHLPDKQNQIKYVILAISAGYFGGAFSFLPAFDIPINPLPTHFVWVYAAIISLAILRHQLMDIHIIFRKGLIYTFLIGIITAIYFALVLFLGTSFQELIGTQTFFSALVIFTLLGLLFKPAERRVQAMLDRFVFKKSPDVLTKENEQLMLAARKHDQMKAVATLAAGMAHEIKNPLTAIKTFTEHLPAHAGDPAFLKKFTKIVGAEVGKIDGIVKQLLEFSKPTAPVISRIDLTQIIESTLHLLDAEFLKHRIEVIKDFADRNIFIEGDKKQLQQVFLNLFLNSVQAMPGRGTLTIALQPQSNNLIEIVISDTGYGISKDNLVHIFDPFFTTRDNGTGLGLAISHGILKEHGARITVESREGVGTSFRILFNHKVPIK